MSHILFVPIGLDWDEFEPAVGTDLLKADI